MNADGATRVASRLEGDALRTTTLRVLDDRPAGAARVCLRAGRAIRHAVHAVDVGILTSTDLHLVDGHGVLAAAAHGWMIIETSGDALVLKGTLGKRVALAHGVGAGEAGEVIAAVGTE